MLIEVTAEDIAKGKRGDPKACALCQTLLRLGFGNPLVMPMSQSVAIEYNSKAALQLVVPGLLQKLREWDEGGEMKPFSIEIPNGPR